MTGVYALIKQGFVRNVIVADDAFCKQIQSEWDYVVRIDELNPPPQMGWRFDGDEFVSCDFDQMVLEIEALNGAENPNAYNNTVPQEGKVVVPVSSSNISWIDIALVAGPISAAMTALAYLLGKFT